MAGHEQLVTAGHGVGVWILTPCSALDLGSQTWEDSAFLVASLWDDPVLR